MAEYGAGTPLEINGMNIWRGQDRTNGFTMKGDRVPILRTSFAKCVIDAANPLTDPYVIAWGNGLWRDDSQIEAQPNTVYAQAPERGKLIGILEFSQGWQTGNPVQNYGVPPYSKANVVKKGLVGYKCALKEAGSEADYLKYLQGDASAAALAAVTAYKDWTALLAQAAGGDLCLFFEKTSGFPIVAVSSNQTLAGADFAGRASLFEPENELIYFDINL